MNSHCLVCLLYCRLYSHFPSGKMTSNTNDNEQTIHLIEGGHHLSRTSATSKVLPMRRSHDINNYFLLNIKSGTSLTSKLILSRE